MAGAQQEPSASPQGVTEEALALAEAAGRTFVPAEAAALLSAALPEEVSDIGLIVDAQANGDTMRILVADLLSAGHKKFSFLGPSSESLQDLRAIAAEQVAEASELEVISAPVWPQPRALQAGVQASTVHVLQATLVVWATPSVSRRRTAQRVQQLAMALSDCLLPHAQHLAESGSVSLLGRLPGLRS